MVVMRNQELSGLSARIGIIEHRRFGPLGTADGAFDCSWVLLLVIDQNSVWH